MHICRKPRKPALSHKGPSARELCAPPFPIDRGTAQPKKQRERKKARKNERKKESLKDRKNERKRIEIEGEITKWWMVNITTWPQSIKTFVCLRIQRAGILRSALSWWNCSSSCSRKWVRRDCVSLFFDSQQIVCVPALIELAMLHFPWSSVLSWPRDGWSSTQRGECASKCAQCWSDNRPSYNHKLPFALVTCDVVKWTKGALLMWSFDPVSQ